MTESHIVIRPREKHNISRSNIDPDALTVLYHLSRNGYLSYLVGGGVRDLLLGRTPKDFDVGTNAHPNQIKKLFRNCFLIGKRFRLAHVKFGEKIIETCTFRQQTQTEADPHAPGVDLHIHRDNTYGTPEEDARRRDFTVNGLFYDIKTFRVIDHVGGLADLDRRIIRSIGDPNIRFREDPVRMIRAVRFASRLGFDIEEQTWDAILCHHREIEKAAKPRMLEEIYRLFSFQSGENSFRLLRKTKLLSVLFPELDCYLDRNGDDNNLLWRCLAQLAVYGKESGGVTAQMIFGTLIYPLVLEQVQKATENNERASYSAIAHELIKAVAVRFQMPKRVFFDVVHMFGDQQRLAEWTNSPDKVRRIMERPWFEESLDLREIYIGACQADLRPIHIWHGMLDEMRRRKPASKSHDEASDSSHRRPRSGRRNSPHRHAVNHNAPQA
jgi:poly(A) polymerase